jgi:hypothetical protein
VINGVMSTPFGLFPFLLKFYADSGYQERMPEPHKPHLSVLDHGLHTDARQKAVATSPRAPD